MTVAPSEPGDDGGGLRETPPAQTPLGAQAALMALAPEAIFAVDCHSSAILEASEEAHALLGYAPGALRGVRIIDIEEGLLDLDAWRAQLAGLDSKERAI
ncbi:MAG: hypothetical protein OEY14_18345, partial [Myxococcales bacterium]|nr:hypothetical protein [Myxococcales bacterium]